MSAVFIVAIVMVFAALMAKMGMDYDLRKRVGEGSDNSMRAGELRQLIRESVAEANAGLEARLDAIEGRLERHETPLLPPEAGGATGADRLTHPSPKSLGQIEQ